MHVLKLQKWCFSLAIHLLFDWGWSPPKFERMPWTGAWTHSGLCWKNIYCTLLTTPISAFVEFFNAFGELIMSGDVDNTRPAIHNMQTCPLWGLSVLTLSSNKARFVTLIVRIWLMIKQAVDGPWCYIMMFREIQSSSKPKEQEICI